MAATFRKPVDDDIDWQQRLINYSSNRDAGKSEYQRAMEKYRAQNAMGDTTGAANSKRWADQVDTAIGGIGSDRKSQINDNTNTLGQKVNAQPFEFKNTRGPYQFDAASNQAYQAALRQAQSNVKTAAGNTAAEMNKRGIMDSTITTDRVGQQAQNEYGRVSDTLLPKIMEQDYMQYMDAVNNDYRQQLANYQAQQDQIGNMSSYIGTLNGMEQQDFQNANQTKRDNWNAYLDSVGITQNLGTGPKSDWSLLGGMNGLPTFNREQFKYGQDQDSIANARADRGEAREERQLNATLSNMSSDNARAAAAEARASGNQQLGALFEVWDRTGVAPEGIPGVPAGTPLVGKPSSGGESGKIDPKLSADNFNEIYEDLNSKGITKQKAIALMQANRDNLTDADYKKGMDYINDNF